MENTMKKVLLERRLRWLGHVARIEPYRIPKQLLFGELQKKDPATG